jgi:hypothetical protein
MRSRAITTYGRDVAVASSLFHRATGRPPANLRPLSGGWRVVAAQVSVIAQG